MFSCLTEAHHRTCEPKFLCIRHDPFTKIDNENPMEVMGIKCKLRFYRNATLINVS